jgi:hypothetical protein
VPKPNAEILEIDLNNLEEECRQQPRLMYDWSKEKKRRVKEIRSRLAHEIRMDPLSHGLEKVTEDSIKELVEINVDVSAAEQDLLLAEEEEEVLAGMVWALVDRREQLSNECGLHGQQYWSKPYTGPSGGEKYRRPQDSAAVADAMEDIDPATLRPKKSKKRS